MFNWIIEKLVNIVSESGNIEIKVIGKEWNNSSNVIIINSVDNIKFFNCLLIILLVFFINILSKLLVISFMFVGRIVVV